MNAFTLWEALTDVDDTQLLEADEKGPVKKPRRQLRYGLVAACLALVLTKTLCAGAMAFHQDTTMRYTVRYRENRVTYLCKARAYLVGWMPQYEPLWVPEGYILNGTFSDEEREKHMSYVNTHVPTDYISITYTQIVGEYKLDLYTLPIGSYERHEITVNGLTGQLYLYTDMRSGGVLIWLDEENRILFRMNFPDKDPANALKMANSIQLKEE